MNKKIIYRAAFCLILILALFLRLYKIDKLLPPYWEEVALGFDAYSISETLRDHHGNFMPIVAFESFGDWKPSLYFYAIIPFIKLFGLEIISVRLPSLISGILIVLGAGALIGQIFPNNKNTSEFDKKNLALLAMFVAAISPWAILFSRAGWEVNLATALIIWGIISFFKFLRSEKKPLLFLLLSTLSLILSMYAYHATRMIAPILGVGLVLIWFSQNMKSDGFFKNFINFLSKNSSKLIFTTIFTLIISFPILTSLSNPSTSQRFRETSIFSNLEVIKESNERKLTQPGIVGKIFYHRHILFAREITKNYLSHFNINFLFLSGDKNPRHSIQYVGQLYHIEIVFLLIGLFFVLKTLGEKTKNNKDELNKKLLLFLFFWLFVGIIPASLTHATPHALRILPTMPVFIIFISLGIWQLFIWFESFNFDKLTKLKNKIQKLKKLNISKSIFFWFIISGIYFMELTMFYKFYTNIYPKIYSSQWQSGYEALFVNFNIFRKNKETIYITRNMGRPLMYYWFYNRTSPKMVQYYSDKALKDQGEYLEFESIKAISSIGEIKIKPAMVVLTPKEFEEFEQNNKDEISLLKKITDSTGEIVLIMAEIR